MLRWFLLQNTKYKAIFETVPILKGKIRVYSQYTVNVRTMLLNKKNRCKTTFEVFSQTTCNVKRIAGQEGSRERKNTEARTTATPSTATDPALSPGRMLQQWRLQISKTEVRWPETTLIQLKLQEEQLKFLKVILQFTALALLKGDWSSAIANAFMLHFKLHSYILLSKY